ncbi:unnamed protein product [Scytosiphon promiscuus]
MPIEDLTKRANMSNYDDSVAKDMPEYPGLALTGHVVLKNIQVWSCVGSLASFGVWLKSPDTSISSLMLKYWPRYAGRGGAAGIVVAAPMMYAKMRTIDLEGLEDRAYRIGLNKGVQTLDFYSAIGGLTAVLVGFSTRRVGSPRVRQAAASVANAVSPWSLMAQGITAGTLTFGLGHAMGLPVEKVSCMYLGVFASSLDLCVF